jgi:SAM-dependent methyltransferase
MTAAYSSYAHICTRFYDLTLDPRNVASFVANKSDIEGDEKVLFVGGMFGIAESLAAIGLHLTVVDYSDEMVALGKQRLPSCQVIKADIRSLPFRQEFDWIFVVGRVLTHMITDADLTAALSSCHQALRPTGGLFADNYEDTRIESTSYFNGTIEAKDESCRIVRSSTTERLSTSPFVVNWSAEYSGTVHGSPFHFSDSIQHRAFSRLEFAEELKKAGLRVLDQGDNFDETSFYTVARMNHTRHI